MIGLASSIISEPCLCTVHSEFGFKNHNPIQSCESPDSSHIDNLNNIYLQELDSHLGAAS